MDFKNIFVNFLFFCMYIYIQEIIKIFRKTVLKKLRKKRTKRNREKRELDVFYYKY